MPEYGFPLTHSFLYDERIEGSALYWKIQVRENLYSGIFYAVIKTI